MATTPRLLLAALIVALASDACAVGRFFVGAAPADRAPAPAAPAAVPLADDARPVGRFSAAAAAVDITPPLAATAASNPADCDLSGTFDGPHLFSLEEPYKDLNG